MVIKSWMRPWSELRLSFLNQNPNSLDHHFQFASNSRMKVQYKVSEITVDEYLIAIYVQENGITFKFELNMSI